MGLLNLDGLAMDSIYILPTRYGSTPHASLSIAHVVLALPETTKRRHFGNVHPCPFILPVATQRAPILESIPTYHTRTRDEPSTNHAFQRPSIHPIDIVTMFLPPTSSRARETRHVRLETLDHNNSTSSQQYRESRLNKAKQKPTPDKTDPLLGRTVFTQQREPLQDPTGYSTVRTTTVKSHTSPPYGRTKRTTYDSAAVPT